MNIIKEILTLPKTNGGKKRRYNLLNQLNIEKKDKNEITKAIDSGNLGGNTPATAQHPFEERYYFDISNIENKQEIVDFLLSADEQAGFETDVNVIIKGVIDNTTLYSIDPAGASLVSGTAFYLKSSTYQLSIKKYIITRSGGSGNISANVAMDIKYILEQLEDDAIELFNNQITADEFWDSITIVEP